MPLSLKNKKIIISAGGSGIGLATAKICLSKGAIVYICDINNRSLVNIKKHPLNNKRLFAFECDASDEDDVKETLVAIIAQLDQGDGVDFETVLTNADARGIDRQLAESKLDELSNEGTLHEPRFGWFRIVS